MSEIKCEHCADIGWKIKSQLGRIRAFSCPFCEGCKDEAFFIRFNDARLPGNFGGARLDNFRPNGPDRDTLVELAKLTRNPDQSFILAGGHGSGKTHLLTAFAKNVLCSQSKKTVIYTSLFDLVAEMRAIYTNGEIGDEHHFLTSDILIIDDFWGITDPSGWNVKLLEKVVTERCQRSLPIVIGTAHFAFVRYNRLSLDLDETDKGTRLAQAFPERLIHMILENGQYLELRGEDDRKARLPESFVRRPESSSEHKRRGPSLI